MNTTLHPLIRSFAAISAFGLMSVTALHAAPSASELLEKGIYSEETKGDLEAAITIYQQLLAETKSSQSLAAEAQFRLGQCFLKKNRTADAVAAFEKLIREYPSEKELVAKARSYLPSELALGPIPWVDGERLQLTLTVARGMDIGTIVYRANLSKWRAEKPGASVRACMPGRIRQVTVDADGQTFLPIASSWKHGLLGEATATYGNGSVDVRKGANEPEKITFEKTTFDNEQAMHVMRRLPLAVGYKATMPVISSLGALMPHPDRSRSGRPGNADRACRAVRLFQGEAARRRADLLVFRTMRTATW